MKNKGQIKIMSIEEMEAIKANISRRDLENKLLEKEAIKRNIEQQKIKRVKTEEEKQQIKERKMQRAEAKKKRKEEAEERIEAKREAERQKFLDSLDFDVRIPVVIDPIYDSKPVFKTEKRQIKMFQAINRLKKQRQIAEDEEQEL